jgi:hypothetical protein
VRGERRVRREKEVVLPNTKIFYLLLFFVVGRAGEANTAVFAC